MPLTIDHIKQRTNEKTYKLGLDIYRNPDQPVIEPARRGDQLLGYYQGSSLEPYRIEVTLDDDEAVLNTSCTCGYKRHDDCKHVVALLITYMHEPETFQQLDEAADPLLQLSRDELIQLVRRMLSRYPDLQALIDEPEQTIEPAHAFSLEQYRQQLREVLHHDVRSRYAAETIFEMVEVAQHLQSQGHWPLAADLLIMILDEALAPEHTAFDEEGRLIRALSQAVEELAHCLGHRLVSEDEAQRRAVFAALLEAYIWETETRWEGLTEHIPATILAYARPDDLPALQTRIEPLHAEAMGEGQLQAANAYHNFLTHLDALADDPAVTLRYLGEQGLYSLQFHKYLQLGQTQDAINVVRQHLTEPDEHLHAVNVLVELDERQAAYQLTETALKRQFNPTLASWLIQQYRAQDDYQAAFRLQRQRMAHNPSLSNYLLLKELGGILGKWAETRPKIMFWLEDSDHHEVLTEIHLEEQDWEAAWESLAAADLSGWRQRELTFEVAQQSRFALPERAIPVYLARVDAYIEARTRPNYQTAAALLQDVRKLHHLLDDEANWQATIEDIRTTHQRLSALQDELDKAGL